MGALGGKGDAPAPPNFDAAATPNQTNAFGVNSNWTQGPTGKYSQTVNFGGPLQGLNQSLQGQAQGAWSTPLDNGDTARQAASNSIYGQEASRLDPQWQQRQHDFQVQMANQGIDPSSAAYSTASGNLNRSQNDAYQSAMNNSIAGGTQAAQQQQQLDMNSRFAPLQGMGAMSGLTGQSQNPLLPAAMAKYQGALQGYGIQQQGKNSMMGGLMGLGGNLGAAAMLA